MRKKKNDILRLFPKFHIIRSCYEISSYKKEKKKINRIFMYKIFITDH